MNKEVLIRELNRINYEIGRLENLNLNLTIKNNRLLKVQKGLNDFKNDFINQELKRRREFMSNYGKNLNLSSIDEYINQMTKVMNFVKVQNIEKEISNVDLRIKSLIDDCFTDINRNDVSIEKNKKYLEQIKSQLRGV